MTGTVPNHVSLTFSPPTIPVLRWLAHPGADTPPELHGKLLATLFGSRVVFFAALVNSVTVAGAIALHRSEPVFFWWFIAELLICVTRCAVLVVAQSRAAAGRSTPTDLHLCMALLWALSIGVGGFIAISSRDWMAIALVCLSAAAMAGGSCLRNYGAPRFAVAVMFLNLAPFALAAAISDASLMLVILVQVPFFLFSMTMGAFHLNRLLVATMRAERDNEHRALHDPLTGLLNRAGLEQGFAQWRGDTLLYIDLDGFKQINDAHGHAAGDAVLRDYGQRLRMIAGADTIVARVGGDEFVVLAPPSATDGAARLGNAIAVALSRPCVTHAETIMVSGASIGFAWPRGDRSLATMMAQADHELYQMKQRPRAHPAHLSRGGMAGTRAPLPHA